MTINKENYPAYFLDYHEGRLSAADEAALFVFLGKHPDLQEAFDAFQPVSVSSWDDSAAFPGKGSLKRGVISPENRDYYFAAYVEGDLSQADRASVEAYAAANPAVARELALMHKTILPVDVVEYPEKDALKRQLIIHIAGTETGQQSATAGAGVPGANDRVTGTAAEVHSSKETRVIPMFMKRWLPYASAAAVLMLLAGLFFLRLPEQPVDGFAHDMHDIQDIPAVGGVDDPVAVADIPLPWQERESEAPQGRSPEKTEGQRDQATTERSPERVQGQRNEATQRQFAQEAPGMSTGSEAGATLGQAGVAATVVADHLPGPRKMGSIGADSKQFAVQAAGPSGLDYRSEFAYWSPASLPGDGDSDMFEDADRRSGSQEMGLAQLAVNRLGQSLPIDFSKAEAHLSENRIPIWLVAEAGLNGLGNMAAKALGLERETDEEGRTIAITAGERFEARRSRR